MQGRRNRGPPHPRRRSRMTAVVKLGNRRARGWRPPAAPRSLGGDDSRAAPLRRGAPKAGRAVGTYSGKQLHALPMRIAPALLRKRPRDEHTNATSAWGRRRAPQAPEEAKCAISLSTTTRGSRSRSSPDQPESGPATRAPPLNSHVPRNSSYDRAEQPREEPMAIFRARPFPRRDQSADALLEASSGRRAPAGYGVAAARVAAAPVAIERSPADRVIGCGPALEASPAPQGGSSTAAMLGGARPRREDQAWNAAKWSPSPARSHRTASQQHPRHRASWPSNTIPTGPQMSPAGQRAVPIRPRRRPGSHFAERRAGQ